MLQGAKPALHDDETVGRHIIAIHTGQLDDTTPKSVIIGTPETFQLVLLLPNVLLCARHPLDHHDNRWPV
eukprot:563037-Lingulodinium_polyedra.AAC.1